MAINKDQRYLGGGRLYFERLQDDGTHSAKIEIGEVKGFKITSEKETVSVETEEGCTPEEVDELVIKNNYSIGFETQQVDKTTLMYALSGEKTVKTYASGETLPDGETATEDTTYSVIDPGEDSITGRVTFVTCPKTGKKKVATFHKVKLKFDGELLLQSRELVTLPFTGKVLKDSTVTEGSKFFRIYEES